MADLRFAEMDNAQYSLCVETRQPCMLLWLTERPCCRAACKFLDASGTGLLSNAILCFEYCANEGAHIISNSWGQYSSSAALQVCWLPRAQSSPACSEHSSTLCNSSCWGHMQCTR